MDEEQTQITTAQYNNIIKRLDTMQISMDRRFEEWSEDRRTINNVDERLKTVEAKIEGARDEIADSQKKVMNKVDEHLSPMPDLVSEAVSEAVKKKKGLFK
jgi:exonuclease VII small subunit